MLAAPQNTPATAQDSPFATQQPAQVSTSTDNEQTPLSASESEVADAPVLDDIIDQENAYNQFMAFANGAMGLLVLAFIGFGGPALLALYRSTPNVVVRELIAGGASSGLRGLEEAAKQRQAEAAQNAIDWDDPLWALIYDNIKKGRLQIEDLLSDAGDPLTSGSSTAKRYPDLPDAS